MILKSIVNTYFKLFESKDIRGLSNLLSDDVSLSDWETNVKSKKAVLFELNKIFNSVNVIKITLNQYLESNNSAICIISINIDNLGILNVLDIFTFNDYKKIISIDAYKQ
tara:strand:+ start:14753 stop:15082 length:330 start_codon:yes stop_codon:yes gene_type:complete